MRILFYVILLVFVSVMALPVSASTIAEIAMIAEGGHATSDGVVILSVTDLVADPGLKSFQVRDTTGAMTIYGTNNEIDAALTGFGVGDMIEIGGYASRLDGALILVTSGGSVSGFAVTGRTSTNPFLTNAINILPSGISQSFESNLVCIHNVLFDTLGIFAVGDYSIAGGSGSIRIATEDLGLSGLAIPTGPVDITGIIIPSGLDGSYRLAPRGPDDIVAVPEPITLLLLGIGGMVLRKSR